MARVPVRNISLLQIPFILFPSEVQKADVEVCIGIQLFLNLDFASLWDTDAEDLKPGLTGHGT